MIANIFFVEILLMFWDFLFRNAENRTACWTDEGEETNFSGLVPEYRASLPRTELVQGLLRGSL